MALSPKTMAYKVGMDIRFFSRASLHERHALFFFYDARLLGFLFARSALSILKQGLCRHYCLRVFVVSHEECVALLFFQASVLQVIRLPNKQAAAELSAPLSSRF